MPPKSRADSNPWPQWPKVFRTSSSLEEGGHRKWNIDSLEFLPDSSSHAMVGGLRYREVEWRNEGTGFKTFPVKGTEQVESADLILLAMGFTGPVPGNLASPESLSKLRGQGGLLEEGIYVAGDAALGPSLVVKAMADGLSVAKRLLNDLNLTHPLKLQGSPYSPYERAL
jgi:glutamate synthase (NADPH/NADH) small chain